MQRRGGFVLPTVLLSFNTILLTILLSPSSFPAFCVCVGLTLDNKIHTYRFNWSLQPLSQDYCPSFSHRLCCVS